MAPNPPVKRTKPLLRGVSHEIAAFAAVPAVAALVSRAEGASGRAAALVYGASLVLLFAVSATYHRPTWSERMRLLLWRLDHSAIFVLIAGTYTPFCLLLGPAGRKLLVAIWAFAAVGVGASVLFVRAPKRLMASLYVLYGWLALPFLFPLHAAIGTGLLGLLLVGGVLYSAGALVYAARRPDPYPTVFGFHEIFHLCVIGAAACHFVVVGAVIRVLG